LSKFFPGFRFTRLASAFCALAVVVPVALAAGGLVSPETDMWSLWWRTTLVRQILTTIGVGLGVSILATALGAVLAWTVTSFRFPGSKVLRVLLVLPIALPGYVVAFVTMGTFDYPGPVQTQWRSWFGNEAPFYPVRSPLSAVIVLTLVLYPYVYVPALAAFSDRRVVLSLAARSLGLTPWQTFRRVLVPVSRPVLASGAALVMMETITDVGVMRIFGVQTLSDGVLRAWIGFDRRDAAGELSVLLLVLVLVVVLGERALRGRGRTADAGAGSAGEISPIPLRGKQAIVAASTCWSVLGAAFFAPMVVLVSFASKALRSEMEGAFDATYISLTLTSLTIAAWTAGACLLLGALTSIRVLKLTRLDRVFGRVASLGYALPGLVIGAGVLGMLAAIDEWFDAAAAKADWLYLPFLFAGSLFGLVLALVIRFLAVARGTIEAATNRLDPKLSTVATLLGAKPRRVVRRVMVPQLRRSLIAAGLLVALDALKELPATLLLRPAGKDTLAVFVWNMTNESRWEEASVPALTIVAVAIPLVLIFLRPLQGNDPSTTKRRRFRSRVTGHPGTASEAQIPHD
jgi:iron(III) transport system permease protein